MTETPAAVLEIDREGDLARGRFRAMASPCELLVEGAADEEIAGLTRIAADEALRIERLWSRYRDDSVVQRINTSRGRSVEVDGETVRMLDYAEQCFELSGGRFDITSGVLREVWTFDGSDRVPTRAAVRRLMARVGWRRASWQAPRLRLPDGMQIDFGGIGKEYAVDRVVLCLRAVSSRPFLVNLGGDLHASAPPVGVGHWSVGIERGARIGDLHRTGADVTSTNPGMRTIRLERGALATSGDVRRYVQRDGVRYGHVLDALTGWPVTDAPRSITVAAPSCTQAGMLATLALLEGSNAEHFLADAGAPYWIER